MRFIIVALALMAMFSTASESFAPTYDTPTRFPTTNPENPPPMEIVPVDCVCADQWSSIEDGKGCLDQNGCANCDNDEKGNWCMLSDETQKCSGQELAKDGSPDGWFYCSNNQAGSCDCKDGSAGMLTAEGCICDDTDNVIRSCEMCVADYFEQGGCDDQSLRDTFAASNDCGKCMEVCDGFCALSKCDQAKKVLASDGFCKATFAGNIDGTDFALGYPNVNLVSTIPMWSASKLVASTFILKLSERRMFRLDTPVGNYIDWWTLEPNDNRSKVTLKHLLSMTSGFGDASCVYAFEHESFTFDELNSETCAHWIYDNFFGDFRGEHGLMPTPEEKVYANKDVVPGTIAQFAESNWLLALYVVEASAERTWTDLFKRYFTDMLDINENNCYWSENYNLIGPGSSLICTIGDYVKFLKARNKGDYVKYRTLDVQQTAWTKVFESETKGIMKNENWAYGLGGWVTDCKGRKQICELIESVGDAGTMPFASHTSYGILGRYEYHKDAPEHSIKKGFTLFKILESMTTKELKKCASKINEDVDYWKHGMDHAENILNEASNEEHNGLSLGMCDPPKKGNKDLITPGSGAHIIDDPCNICLLYFFAEEGCKHIKDTDFNPKDYVPPSCHHLVDSEDSQCAAKGRQRCESGKPIYKFPFYSKKKKNLQRDLKPFVPMMLSPMAESSVGDGEMELETFAEESDESIIFQTKNMAALCFGIAFLAIVVNVHKYRKNERQNQNDFQLFLTDVDEI